MFWKRKKKTVNVWIAFYIYHIDDIKKFLK